MMMMMMVVKITDGGCGGEDDVDEGDYDCYYFS